MMNHNSNPPMMSFAGLEVSNPQKSHLWDWEAPAHSPPTATPAAFYSQTPFLDSQPPPLLPITGFPFYSPPPVPDYPSALIKREEVASVGGGRIGLNLGHRTYFSSGDALTIDRLFAARSRGIYSFAHHQPPRCQAEGCKADLSGAKHYHRRHKVCEFHSKATVVIAGGLQQRFCQQCSRFHVLTEFDEAKRSCRKRLADHNRRRRKPQLPAPPSDPKTTDKTKNTSSNPKPARDNSIIITSSKGTTTSSASMSNGSSTGLEMQYQSQNKGAQLKSGPALSLGGVGGSMEKGNQQQQQQQQQMSGLYSQQQQEFYGVMSEEKGSSMAHHHFPSPSSSNSNFFYHQNLFGSSSSEAPQSTGGGVGGSDHHQHHSNLLHLGQGMFEVDFM